MDHNIQPPKPLNNAGPEQINLLRTLDQVERHKAGAAAAHGADRVIGLLQPALGAAGDDAMRAHPRQFHRHRGADPA